MANLSNEDICKLAELSQIEIDNKSIDKFRKEIVAILEYVEQLAKVDTDGLEPTSQITGLKNVTKDDGDLSDQMPREKLLKNVPESENGYIKVKRVI